MINFEKFKQIFWMGTAVIFIILLAFYAFQNLYSYKTEKTRYEIDLVSRRNKITGKKSYRISTDKWETSWTNLKNLETSIKNKNDKWKKIERAKEQAELELPRIPEGYKLVRPSAGKGMGNMKTSERLSAIFLLFMFIVVPIAWYKIFKKAGYSGAWCLLMFFPIINIAAMALFAFSVWPIEREPSGPGIKKVGKML